MSKKKKVRRKKGQKDKEVFGNPSVIDLDEERKARKKEVREKAEAKRRKTGSKSFREEIMGEVESSEYPGGRGGKDKASAPEENKKPKKSKKVFVIIILIFIAVMVAMVYSASSKIMDLRTEEAEYKQEIADLKIQKENLEGQISDIGSDEYVMKQARSWLKMAKSGELVYIFNN